MALDPLGVFESPTNAIRARKRNLHDVRSSGGRPTTPRRRRRPKRRRRCRGERDRDRTWPPFRAACSLLSAKHQISLLRGNSDQSRRAAPNGERKVSKITRRRRSRFDFVYDARWRKIRARVLERDGYQCCLRLPGCTIVATSADHIVALEDGGLWYAETNLRASCENCNKSRAARRRKRARTIRPSRERESVCRRRRWKSSGTPGRR
jgi:5-methylcytosine-specific restriction endonuclease McrA